MLLDSLGEEEKERLLHRVKSGEEIGKVAREYALLFPQYTNLDSLGNAFRKELNTLGVRRILTSDFDQSFFESIDTEAKAYVFGFMVGDGSVNRDGFSLAVALKDEDILLKIATVLNYKKSLGSWSVAKYIHCKSVKARQDLINLGVVPRKSYINILPLLKFPPEPLMRHFLRGLFDSDGGLSGKPTGVLGDRNRWHGYFVQGRYNKELVSYIFNYLKDTVLIEGKLYIKEDRADAVYNKDSLFHLLSYLYDNAVIYLDRKWRLANLVLH